MSNGVNKENLMKNLGQYIFDEIYTFSLNIFHDFSTAYHDLQGSFSMTARRRAAVPLLHNN